MEQGCPKASPFHPQEAIHGGLLADAVCVILLCRWVESWQEKSGAYSPSPPPSNYTSFHN